MSVCFGCNEAAPGYLRTKGSQEQADGVYTNAELQMDAKRDRACRIADGSHRLFCAGEYQKSRDAYRNSGRTGTRSHELIEIEKGKE